MTDIYSTPDDFGYGRASDIETSLGERIGAQASEAFLGGMRGLGQSGDIAQAEGHGTPIGGFAHQEFLARRGIENAGALPPEEQAPQPPTSTEVMATKAQADQQVADAGVSGRIKLSDQSYRQGVLDLMIAHAREGADYDAAVARGPQGMFPGALGFVTEMGVGAIDPLNATAFMIPVAGEARWGAMLARAGDSMIQRAGVRALQGGAQGGVGGAALVPADWWLHTQDGQDYTMADALRSVVMSGGMGGAFHATFGRSGETDRGFFGDLRARARGLPLPGSLEDLRARALTGDTRAAEIVERLGQAGTHVPAAALGEEGVPLEHVPGISAPQPAPATRAATPNRLEGLSGIAQMNRELDARSLPRASDRDLHQDETIALQQYAAAAATGDEHELYGAALALRPFAIEEKSPGHLVDADGKTVAFLDGGRLWATDDHRLVNGQDVRGFREIGPGEPSAPHPAEQLADLPVSVQADAFRAAAADVINGRPGRAGDMLAEAAKEDPRIAESVPGIDAYHGSPHDFDRFSLEHVGEGEGAQSYGHGLYFGEAEGTGLAYRDSTARLIVRDETGRALSDQEIEGKILEAIRHVEPSYPANREAIAADMASALRAGGKELDHYERVTSDDEPSYRESREIYRAALKVVHQLRVERSSNLYRVRINADREHFLDWDKPLSEQPAAVQRMVRENADTSEVLPGDLRVMDALQKDPNWKGKWDEDRVWRHIRDTFPGISEGAMQQIADRVQQHIMLGTIPETFSGERIHHALVGRHGPEKTAQLMREAGIPGIKYLDEGSRPLRGASRDELQVRIATLQSELSHAEAHPDEFANDRDFHQVTDGIREKIETLEHELKTYQGPTRNFVVFDDKLIRITHKNGEEVGLDEFKASRPQAEPRGPAPGMLRTGRPAVDELLAEPDIAAVIENGPVDRAHDVPYEAGASEGSDPTTHLDQRLPEVAELDDGQKFLTAIPARIHEQVEKRAMERMIAAFRQKHGREPAGKEMDQIYEAAHHEFAEVAEDAWYRSQGLDIDAVNRWWAKQDKITEHENPKNPPPDLYKKPYPHNVVEGVKHEERGAAAEWPTEPLPGENAAASRQRRTKFSTSKGSTYEVHEDGTTTRNKAFRPEHGEAEQGLQPRSDRTVYVKPEDAQRLALPQGGTSRIVEHPDGTLSVATKNRDGKWGIAPSARNVPFEAAPRLGANPIELWDRETVNGLPGYRKIHLGNDITDVAPAGGPLRAPERRSHTTITINGRTVELTNGKANWEKFAGRPPEDPADVAASHAAEATPEPASVDPAKAPSAAEAAANEAEARLKELLLTDDERKRVEDALAELKLDKEARETIVRDGAQCLIEAVA